MSAVPAEWVSNAITEIRREYPQWTVQAYNGALDIEPAGDPLVLVAIENYLVDDAFDRMTGDTYARARVVCYLIQPRDSATAYNTALANSSALLSFMRIQPFHEKADRVFPIGVEVIPEDSGGYPITHRVVWAIMLDVMLILDSDLADEDVFGDLVVAQPIRNIEIGVEASG